MEKKSNDFSLHNFPTKILNKVVQELMYIMFPQYFVAVGNNLSYVMESHLIKQ